MWNTVCEMGRAYLAEAQLPKRYWFWAIWTAVQRMNMLPCRSPTADIPPNDAGEFELFPEVDTPDTGRRAFLYARLVSPPLRHNPGPLDPDPPFPHGATATTAPLTSAETLADIASRLTTPFELFHGTQPDYCVIFPCVSIGYYRRPLETSSKK